LIAHRELGNYDITRSWNHFHFDRVGGKLMRCLGIVLLAACILSADSRYAKSSTLVLASQAGTVDTDADSVPDLVDNAPGIANNQADTDADGIGDAIDPTPNLSNPALGDPGLGVYSSPSIFAGGTATFNYLTTLGTPPGAWGYVQLDFDLDNTPDALYFGQLSSTIDTIAIPASLFVNASWDLYTSGTYTVGMKAFAPGMHSENWAYPNVTVLPVPEPASMLLMAAGAIAMLWQSFFRKAKRC